MLHRALNAPKFTIFDKKLKNFFHGVVKIVDGEAASGLFEFNVFRNFVIFGFPSESNLHFLPEMRIFHLLVGIFNP